MTLECAGNGRSRYSPRPLSQPWIEEAIGHAEWTGTPLAPLLEEAGIEDGAVEVLFTGLDRGIQGEVEHAYERSLPLDEALRPEMLLAYEVNGQTLPPQHGFPLRLIVPGWYGMSHVKWLDSITVLTEPFEGYQQDDAVPDEGDRRGSRRARHAHAPALDDDPARDPRLPRPEAIPRGRPLRARRPRLVGLGPDHSGRGEHRRRRDLGRTPPSTSRSASSAGSAGPTAGTTPAGRARALLPRDRRSGQRPAGRGRIGTPAAT